jgi:2-polyprenyl-3-methyl-5-hydroxy-6-metoxy-1,4-benzoquinol methylase
MTNFSLLMNILRSGRLLKRAAVFGQYIYHHALEIISPRFSLERPRFKSESRVAASITGDLSNSIEFHLVPDANACREFNQPNPAKQSAVTTISGKFQTSSCFTCDSQLTPVIQVINANQTDDYIEVAWCSDCDEMQYSVMPSKEWITRWYAAHWDSNGTIGDKLEHRRTTHRYLHRLAPFLDVKRKLKVLDIGSGYGEKIHAFALAGHEVHCTEATPRRAEYLKEHITQNVYLGTLDTHEVRESLRKNGPFDLIFSYHVVEHIYNARAELQILREIAADNAIFYLAIPELYKEGVINNIYSLEHITSFSRLSAKTLMKQIGFRTIVDKDDIFQYYSNSCQYLIGRKESPGESTTVGVNCDLNKMHKYLAEALNLDRIASLTHSAFSYEYNAHAKLTYTVSEESKIKCRNPERHFPIRIYHHDLPLIWMQS